MSRPRMLLADDHRMMLEAFKSVVEPDVEVVGMVTDGRALLDECSRLHPDVVLLDIAMPLLNGLDAGRQLRARHPSVKLIYLTMSLNPDLAGEALRLGASGYVLKSSAVPELKQAIQEALAGRSYITPLITRDVVGALIHPRSEDSDLTVRQREVLQLLAEGKSMKEVAAILDLTPRTVAFHKYQMMKQLKVTTTAELIQYAVKHHIV